MKKLLSVLSSTLQGGLRGGLLTLALLATTSLWAYDFQSGDLYYNITSDSTVEVTEGNYSGEIIIPETVTYNGIAYSVTSIGYGAFDYCSSLTSVTIGNSVTSIGNRAFEKCSSLTSITIPNSVTSIGEYAFRRSSLFSITIPNNVTSIGTLAFDCSSLTSVVWNATNYTSSAQYRFNNAIDSSQITSFTFGDSVKHIPAYLCDGMENLQSVVIPNSVTSIGEGTFYGCSSLTSITIPNSVTSVGGQAFESCYSLTSITIPNSITSIKERTFYGCPSLTSITIPNSVTSIGSNAFNGCSSITSITIPENVTSIGIDAFSNCSSLTSVIWNVINYQSSALSTFSDDVSTQITSFIFGDSVKFIPSYLCANMSALTSIIIPNGVDSIGQAVFGNCDELSSIVVAENNSKYDSRNNCNAIIETETNIIIAGCKTTVIPTSIATIGDYAFYNSLWLTSLVIPNTITTIGNFAFKDCTNLTSITIPNSVTTIGNYSFQNCVGITSVTIPSSVTKIKYGPFAGCVALSSIIVDKNNTTFDSRENCNAIIETETNTLIAGCKNTIIPNGVTCLQYGAFFDCKDLTSIQLPNTITTIENDVFRGCSQLTSIVIPSSVKSIERQPFWECYALSSISVDSDNPTYDSRNNCNAIIETSTNTLIAGCPTTIIPTSVTSIGSGAFQTQHHLTSITIPNGVTTIGYSAFDNCHNLTSVTMGNTITNIEDYAFWMCYSLDTMKCYTAVPPKCTNSSFLMGTPSTVYVPCSSFEAYKSHEIWGKLNIQCLEDTPPSEPQDTTIYHPTEYATICEGETYIWMGMPYTEMGTYTYEEIVEDENYIYHYIHTLELQVIAPPEPDTIVVEAYDSYEWHGVVYTESGTYIYEEHCYQEILQLTIIPSEEKEYLYIYLNELICDGYDYRDPITGEYYLISSWFHNTWSDTITGTEVDTIYTFNITPIVAPEPLTEDMLYAIGAVPKLVAGEMVNTTGTTEPIMWYYQMNDKDDIADVIGVKWVAGHDVVLDTEQTTHTMVLEVWDECDDIIPKEFTFPVSKKDSEPQDTTIYIYHTEDVTICEGETLIWMGMEYTETGTYTYASEKIVEEDDYIYIYHNIYTLHLMVLPPTLDMYEVTAYDSYEWHGVVYTESGVYTYSDPYNPCVIEELHLTIIDTPTIPTEYATICEGETYIWRGKQITEAGTYIYEEIVEDEDYTYHHTYTLELTVLPYETIEYEVEAYDSYVWHGIVYTESGTYTYQYECTTEVLYLTIIPSEDNQGEVVVEPSTNSVTITWQKEDNADTYIIVIKQGDKVVCTLIFDAEGNLVSVNYLPGRESNKHGIQHAGLTSDSFQYTITGLTPSTDYTYTVTATDDSDNTISSYSGEFTTHHATSVENTNSQSPTIDCQKILYEDHIYILRDGKIYTIMGTEVK